MPTNESYAESQESVKALLGHPITLLGRGTIRQSKARPDRIRAGEAKGRQGRRRSSHLRVARRENLTPLVISASLLIHTSLQGQLRHQVVGNIVAKLAENGEFQCGC